MVVDFNISLRCTTQNLAMINTNQQNNINQNDKKKKKKEAPSLFHVQEGTTSYSCEADFAGEFHRFSFKS